MKVSLDKIISYQEAWKSDLPFDKATLYIALSRTLMHKIIDNNNQLPCILSISGDFSDEAIQVVLSKITNQKLNITQITGYKIVQLT